MNRATGLLAALESFEARSNEELQAVERIRELAAGKDAWARTSPLHATGSAVVVHSPTCRVLLRWHERMRAWLQVGGHADPQENDPYAIAVREAIEETGLTDLVAWPDPATPQLIQLVIVPVPPGKGEPAHQHADFRYALATRTPDAATPETPSARLAWLDVDEAISSVADDNLRVCLRRIARSMRSGRPDLGATVDAPSVSL